MAILDKVVILNPFDPSKRKTLPVTIEPGQALASYLDDDGLKILTILNGKIIPPNKRGSIIPCKGDQLIVAPVLAGGDGGGKAILRTIALIGIAILAAVVPLSLALTPLATAALSAGIMVGGGLLINAILPMPKMEQTKDSQTYGWNGPVLASRQGLPIPKPFGKFKQGGNVISSYVKTQGDKQYLNVLISYGFGPAIGISDIRINDNPISNYSGIQYEVRLGLNDQKPVSFFSDSINDRPQQKRLRTGEAFFTVEGDRDDTQGLEVEFFFPKGIWAGPDANGHFDEWSVFGTMEYKLHSDATWKSHILPGVTSAVGSSPYWIAVSQEIFGTEPIIIVYATDNSPSAHKEGDPFDEMESVDIYDESGNFIGTETRRHVGTWTKNPGNPATGVSSMGGTPQTVQQWNVDNFIVASSSQAMKRYVVRIDHLTSGKYDVRVMKRGAGESRTSSSGVRTGNPGSSSTEDFSRRGEEMWLGAIREIIYDDFIYPNMVLLGVRALATDQLSGGGINITSVVDTGISNGSQICQQMMTNTLWGGAIPANLVGPSFQEWEDFCADLIPGDDILIPRGDWHGVFDTSGTLWEQLAVVCAVCRGAIIRTGINYSVIIDKPAVPSQLFTVGNIIESSFKETWLALADRANSIDIRYSDSTNNYEVTPLTVELQDALGLDILKGPVLDGRGIVTAARAFHECELRLRQTALLKKSVTFDAPIEAIACQVGEVIKVQHDVPQWGEGGKILNASDVTHIKLDKEVTIEAGHDYVLTIIFPALVIQTGTTVGLSGSITNLDSAVDTDYQRLRLILPDAEFEVSNLSGTLVQLVKPSALTGAQPYTLVAIDAIETRVVTNVPSESLIETDDIVVSPGFSGLPFPCSAYAFGKLLHEAVDFRVVSMGRSSEDTYSIGGLEYKDEFYGEIDPILPPAPSGADGIGVTDLDAHEAFAADASLPRLAISWRPGKYTRGADLYLSSVGQFVPLPPIVVLISGGTIGFLDVWLRLTYTMDDGSETAASLPIKVSGANVADNAVTIIDRGATLDGAQSFNIYVASVSPNGPEPLNSAYRFALGTTNELDLVLATTGANSGSGENWVNPANVNSASSFAVVSLDATKASSKQLDASFALSIPTEPIAGIIVTLEAAATLGSISNLTDNLEIKLFLGGMWIGTAKTVRVSGAVSTFVLGSAGDPWGTAITSANLNDASFRVSVKGTFKGTDAGSDMPALVVLNGWGPNAHVGDYESGISQSHSFGLSSATTKAYANPSSAFDGSETTSASSTFQHTHQYAGLVLGFTNPLAPTIPNGLVLRILSEVPFNGQYGLTINNRSAGAWYSINAGSTWTQIYNAAGRSKQWDRIVIPNGTNPANVQVLFFNDGHDNMAQFVYKVTLGVPPVDQISIRNVNIQVFGTPGTSSFGIGGSAELDDIPSLDNAPLGIQPSFIPPHLIASVERQHEFIAPIESSGFYIVRAVGFDAIGKRANYNTAPVVSVTVLGDGSLPRNITSFRVTTISLPNITLTWDAITDPDIDHLEIRFNFAFDGVIWERSTSIATPASTATTATLSNGAGSYLIKAINVGGKESGIASLVVASRTTTQTTGDPNPDPIPRGGPRKPVSISILRGE